MQCPVMPRPLLTILVLLLGSAVFVAAPKLERIAPRKKMPPSKVKPPLIKPRR